MDIVTSIPFREIRRVFNSVINSHQLLVELRNIDVIDKLQFEQLRILSKDILSELLLREIVTNRKITWSALIYVLTKFDNSTVLFNYLQIHFRQSQCTSVNIARMGRVDAGIKPAVKRLFTDYKVNFLNAEELWKTPLLELPTEQNKLQLWLQLSDNPTRRKTFVDMNITLLANVIDGCVVIYTYTKSLDQLFTDLSRCIIHSSNADLSNVVLYSRKALLRDVQYYGHNRKYDDNRMPLTDGRDMLTMAHMCASALTPSLEIANLFYLQMDHELWKFELDPTQEIKQHLLHLGHITLDCLNHENDEFVRVFFESFIHVKRASCLLGIGNNLRIIERYIPDVDDIKTASRYLKMFQTCRKKLTSNRRVDIWYNLAEARLHDLSGKLSCAYRCAKKAYGIAMQGHFRFRLVEVVKSFYEEIKKAYKGESSMPMDDDIVGDKRQLGSSKHSTVLLKEIANTGTFKEEGLFKSYASTLSGPSESSREELNDNDCAIDTTNDDVLLASGGSKIEEPPPREEPKYCSKRD